jgi:tRNA (cmo5U34)-methyltransferase
VPTALDNGPRSPKRLLSAAVARLLGRKGTRQIADDPMSYGTRIRAVVPSFDVFQDTVAEATRVIDAHRVLDLGIGTGETARRVLELHPHAQLVGLDASGAMAKVARAALPSGRAEVFVRRLEEPLPAGDFDLVVSALAVHHLASVDKADLFARIASALTPGGVFALGDVVVPENAEDQVTPIEPGVDLPDRLDDQVRWLADAGLEPTVVWAKRDLAVVRATRREVPNAPSPAGS